MNVFPLRTTFTQYGKATLVPLFCDTVLKRARSRPDEVGLFNVRRQDQATVVEPFETMGPLFKDQEIAAALTAGTEDGLFESLLLRGMLDE